MQFGIIDATLIRGAALEGIDSLAIAAVTGGATATANTGGIVYGSASGVNATITADSGALAGGIVSSDGFAGGNASLTASGAGATVNGRVTSTLGGLADLSASGEGAEVSGSVVSVDLGDALINASSDQASAGGFASATGVSQAYIQAGQQGARARGYVSAVAGSSAFLNSMGFFSRVWGASTAGAVGDASTFESVASTGLIFGYVSTLGDGLGCVANFTATGTASFGHAFLETTGDGSSSDLSIEGDGATAFGYISGQGGDAATMLVTGAGSLAFGRILTGGTIRVTGAGSVAGGNIQGDSLAIEAIVKGAFAFGSTHDSADAAVASISASAVNAFQFGPGSNDTEFSLQVGSGLKFIGTSGADPGVPANGMAWLGASGKISFQSDGVTWRLDQSASITAPSGGVVQDAESRTAIGSILAALDLVGITA